MDDIELAERSQTPSEQPSQKRSRERSSFFEMTKEDTFEIQDHFDRLKVSELSCAILAIVGFGCASMIYDLTYTSPEHSEAEITIDYLFTLSTTSTALLLISLTWRTYLEFIWQRSKEEYASHQTMFTSGKYKQLLLELFICVLHPFTSLRGEEFDHYNSTTNSHAKYSYNAILACCTLLRVYLPIRYLSIATYYRSGRAQRVCEMNGAYAGSWFSIKCSMQDNPLQVVSFLMVLSILMGGYAFRVFERPFVEYSGKALEDYGNTMWLVILTMTTVGYGDYFPVTFMGRTIGFCVCLWGVLVVSLMVVALANMLTLGIGEQSALLLFNRLEFKEHLRETAAKVIGSMFRYKLLYRREPDNAKKLKEQLGEVRMRINQFQNMKLQARSLYALDSTDDRIERKVNSIVDSCEETQHFFLDTLARLQRIRRDRERLA